MQIRTKMGQHQMWFSAPFFGSQANLNCEKWVLHLALDWGGRAWADLGPVEQLRKRYWCLNEKNCVLRQSRWTANQALSVFQIFISSLFDLKSCLGDLLAVKLNSHMSEVWTRKILSGLKRLISFFLSSFFSSF